MATKDEILAALRREPLTVAQLCQRLGVTRTAVSLHLKHLEAAGLVRPGAARRRGGAGKPAVTYEVAAGTEDVGSTAYRPFLLALLAALQDHMREAARADLFEAAGRRLAREAGLADPPDFATGLRAAMAAADALGATTEAERHGTRVMVRNRSCPLARAVRHEACVCRALAAFFSEATGRPAKEQCLRRQRLTCQYLIDANEPGLPAHSTRAAASRIRSEARKSDGTRRARRAAKS